MKRFLSLVLAIALVLPLMPAEVFCITANAAAEQYFTYEVRDGKAIITGCTKENNYVMEIPSSIDGYPVVEIGAHAFEGHPQLMDLTIPEGVETIGAYAFCQCQNLSWVELPNSLVTIGDNAFFNCTLLVDVWFGYGLKTIGEGAFAFCYDLDDVLVLPYTLESIGMSAFYDCNTLEQVRLPDSLKELGAKAFAMCDRLEYIVMPSNLEKLGADVFYQSACYNSSYNWSGDAFIMGSYLLDTKTSISGSYEVFPRVTHIADEAFLDCSNLTEVILPEDLKIIGAAAFKDCDKLQNVVFPTGVTTIGQEAFYGCKALADVQIPDSVTSIGQDAFAGTAYYDKAESWENDVLYVGSQLVSCKSSVSGTLQVRPGTKSIAEGALEGRTKITEVILPDSVTTIGEKAFYGCTGLKSISLGKGVSEIGAAAFAQCSNLENITVDPENTNYRGVNNCLIQNKSLVLGCKTSEIPTDGSVTGIGAYAFEGCSGLTELTIPDQILTIGKGAFRDCNNLKTVRLGNGVQIVGERAFEECDVLSQVDFGQSVHTIEGWGFAYNHQLTRVELPASLRYLGEEAFSNSTGLVFLSFQEGIESIGKNCFAFSENLESLHLPDSLQEIGDGAFYSCEKIGELILGQGLVTIGSSAFDGCKALKTLVIPDRVETIGVSAFYECTSLQQVDLGNVKEIGRSAFESCTSLKEVHIPASVTSVGKQAFAYCESVETMTVSPQNLYYHSSGNCIILTADKYLVSGCKNSVIPADGSVSVIQGYAFAGCKGLKSIVVPDTIVRIDPYAFYRCNGLEFMQLPFLGGSKTGDSYLGYIFGGGPSQNDLYVPAALKRVEITGGAYIGDSGFSKCTGLREIVLPESIISIGYDAFANCKNLEWVVVPGNLQRIKDAGIFSGTPYAMLRISKGQENTIELVKDYEIRHQIGGLITFRDDNGQVIEQTWYPVTREITAPTVDPKPSDEKGSYRFAGWDTPLVPCDGNKEYTATYMITYIDYTVVFKDWDGSVISTQTYHYGDKVTAPGNPTREAEDAHRYAYIFDGWDSEVIDCVGDATYTATYYLDYVDYTVTFQYEDGTVIEQLTLHYGDAVTAPVDPAAPGTGYAFSGWDKEITVCQGNAVYTAIFARTYIAGDVNGDGKVDQDDVVYLLLHTMFGEAFYPLNNAPGDIDGNGKIQQDDAVYLLLHTMFGEAFYPLQRTT